MKATENGWTAVFVYGSLRRGLHNHDLLTRVGAEFVGTARVLGRLVGLGSFPGFYRSGAQRSLRPVVGEIYLVNAAGLEALDRLEGHPTLYRRETVTALLDDDTETDVAVYVFQMRRAGTAAPEVPLTNGEYDWVAYYHEEAERVGGSR